MRNVVKQLPLLPALCKYQGHLDFIFSSTMVLLPANTYLFCDKTIIDNHGLVEHQPDMMEKSSVLDERSSRTKVKALCLFPHKTNIHQQTPRSFVNLEGHPNVPGICKEGCHYHLLVLVMS